jgi:hypothetical protein
MVLMELAPSDSLARNAAVHKVSVKSGDAHARTPFGLEPEAAPTFTQGSTK